jgi:SAM-dependent methyltransferase
VDQVNKETARRLEAINRRFYTRHAIDFSKTRRLPWPGWVRIVEAHRARTKGRDLSVLDAGCGNGRFAAFLSSIPGAHTYLGIDASRELLHEAERAIDPRFVLREADLLGDSLDEALGDRRFSLIVLMGVLHHVPGADDRALLLARLGERLIDRGTLAVSIWRFGVKERFARKVVPWSSGAPEIDEADLEPGDQLLRFGAEGLRYCHFISEPEIEAMTRRAQVSVIDTFLDDGQDRDLNRYLLFSRP